MCMERFGKIREYVPGRMGQDKQVDDKSSSAEKLTEEVSGLIRRTVKASRQGDFESVVSLRRQRGKLQPGDIINELMIRDATRFARLEREGVQVRRFWPGVYLAIDYRGFLGDCPTSTLIHYSRSAQKREDWDAALIFQGLLVKLHPDNNKMRGVLEHIQSKQKLEVGRKLDDTHVSDWPDWPTDYTELDIPNILNSCSLSTLIHYSRLAQQRYDRQNALIFQREVVRRRPDELKALNILSHILFGIGTTEAMREELDILERMAKLGGLSPKYAGKNEERIRFLRELLKDK